MAHDYNRREVLQMVLGSIQHEIDPAAYPETDAYISAWFDSDQSTTDLTEISNQLMDCDVSEELASSVADFIIPTYEAAAEAGDMALMLRLGSLYYTGRAGEQSYEKAFKWYKKAYDMGFPDAAENLGYCYYYGRSVPIDYEQAYKCFTKGAMVGMPNSMYKIGDMYRYGYYVHQDPEMAWFMYDQAFHNLTDDLRPQIGADIFLRLADCCFDGIGRDRDCMLALGLYSEAERWFYPKLRAGDRFALSGLEHVLARQQECRLEIAKDIKLLHELKSE